MLLERNIISRAAELPDVPPFNTSVLLSGDDGFNMVRTKEIPHILLKNKKKPYKSRLFDKKQGL